MKYIIELETDRVFQEINCVDGTKCKEDECPFWVNTGDSFVDCCALDWQKETKVNVRIKD